MAAPFGRPRTPPREVCPVPPGVRGGHGTGSKRDAYDPGVIYLLRHGEAEPRGGGVDDALRQLTTKGERQAEAAGRALAALGVRVDTCLTSPKVRAADTARLAAAAIGVEPEVAAELSEGPFDSIDLAVGRGETLLVGHEPDFSNEIARLTGANTKLRKGGLAIVDGNILVALLRPDELVAVASSAS
jgi:phosphohistidine phosphatase